MHESIEYPLGLDHLVEAINHAESNILMADENLRVLVINPAFSTFFELFFETPIQKGDYFLTPVEKRHPEKASSWKQLCQRALHGFPSKTQETLTKGELTLFLEIHFHPVRHESTITGLSIFARDVTLRRNYEKRILESEANMRSILNNTEDSIWLVNPRWELIDFNKTFEQDYRVAFNVQLERGKNIIELLPDHLVELRAMWIKRYAGALSGMPGRYIDQYTLGDQLHTFEIKTYPIYEGGKVTGVTIYSRDISKTVENEQKLEKQNQELSKINTELDRFVYSASHDLRAPLLSVKGILQLLAMEKDPVEKEKLLEMIGSCVDKLDGFIKDIIDYSRNARLELTGELVDFPRLIKEAEEAIRYMEGANTIQITSIQDPQLQGFKSDQQRLQIIFNNIISNAIRYRHHFRESTLHIETRKVGDVAVISFEDNGIGIQEEYLAKVFDMFFRADSSSQGSGLGLYIVKESVDKLKGKIDVHSKPGKGTTFIITLPSL
jgi:signal transduction histidine kinase